MHEHPHETGINLTPEQRNLLLNGYQELFRITEGVLAFQSMPSERYPLPLTTAACGQLPDISNAISEIKSRVDHDPISVLEKTLPLVELYESNLPDSHALFPGDMAFVSEAFGSKRANGWCYILGGDEGSRADVEEAISRKWQFKFFKIPSPYRPTGIYILLERLVRYAFVYGKCRAGNPHAMSHFIEEHTPGVIVCLSPMNDFELLLSLVAMKMGVPAVVPQDYPFTFGRTIRVGNTSEISDAVVGFANIRRLLPMPDIPEFPPYCLEQKPPVKLKPSTYYGNTGESYYFFRKGNSIQHRVNIIGSVDSSSSIENRPLGVLIEADVEPLDSIDCEYIEKSLPKNLWRLEGCTAEMSGGKLIIGVAGGFQFDPLKLGEVLQAAIMHEFPKICKIEVTVNLDGNTILQEEHRVIEQQRKERSAAIKATSEETMSCFYSCTGCSPFAPDHVCILTVDRVPQCGRPFEMIKTGAHYGYDDMSNIHHSKYNRDINSFLVIDKGVCLDPIRGEWSGVNEQAIKMTAGRTQRILLHTLSDAPTTGCGCFNFILFKTDVPRAGIGIMDNRFAGAAPDGRRWSDLHYSLAGKQTPGISGCGAGYFRSLKFLQGDGGWGNVVWVTKKAASLVKDRLPIDAVISE